MMRDQPLLEAIAASAVATCYKVRRREGYALLWSFWRLGDPESLLKGITQ